MVEKRENIHWGAFSIVKATLNAMELIVNLNKSFDYLVLLSGQDYPIKSNDYISNYFSKFYGNDFIEFFSIPGPSPYGYDFYMYHFMDIRNIYLRKFFHGFSRLLALIYKRKFFRDLTPFGGSAWWAISYNSTKFIIDFVKKNPRIIKFFKRTILPDEMFFQTLILNSPNSSNVINNNLRFIQWTGSSPNPSILTKHNFELLKESPKLFARKLDLLKDKEIFDLLDKSFQ